ncbi:MAG TPA: hypothetical protein VMK84_21945 [Streptosporangiaceae bacterium]|nr:hypothetical protein [Streptosporangiaceae bacterium]
MGLLDSWTPGSHTADGITHPTYRKGSGPGVIVIHEIPGITPAVIAVGARFDTLRRELGGNFIAVEFPGRKHATLTEHRQQDGVDRVLRFFEDKLKVASDQQPDEASRPSP